LAMSWKTTLPPRMFWYFMNSEACSRSWNIHRARDHMYQMYVSWMYHMYDLMHVSYVSYACIICMYHMYDLMHVVTTRASLPSVGRICLHSLVSFWMITEVTNYNLCLH
jgi:hypothetical protein